MARPKGHPRSFKDDKDFMNKFDQYLDRCVEAERLANIAGFCAYCSISRETFYAQDNYYSDTFKVIQAKLEDEAINHKATSMGIFYLKNKFGYVDKVETSNTNHNINEDVTELTTEERKARIKELLDKNKNG